MFMLKIGTDKHKFKLKFVISKFKYKGNNYLKLNLQDRGSHTIEIFSLPSKKQTIKFAKTQYFIPLTLFYKEEERMYLQKNAEIKAYSCDQNGHILKTIGKTQLNIAQYANNTNFALQIIVESDNKKNNQQAIITFHMNMQRQDDDSKSVNTYSDQQSTSSKVRDRSKSKQNKNFLFQSKQKDFQVRSTQQRRKDKQSYQEIQQKRSNKQSTRNKVQLNKQKRPSNEINIKDNKKNNIQQDEQNNFFGAFQQDNKKTEPKQDKIKSQNKLFEQVKKIQTKARPLVSRKEKKTQKTTQTTQKGSKLLAQQDQDCTTLSELQKYQYIKAISTLTCQKQFLQKQSVRLKQIITSLLSQKQHKQLSLQTQSVQSQQKLKYYKKIIIEKEMKINQLQGLNKIILVREEQREKELKELRVTAKQGRERLEHEKNRMARIMQLAMESGNLQFIDILETQIITNDNY